MFLPPEGLTEEELSLLEQVRRLAREKIQPRAAEIDETGEFPFDIKEELAALGLLGYLVPRELGGLGGRITGFIAIVEEIARVCFTSANILTQQALGQEPILLAGSKELQERFLIKMATGEYLGSFGLTEPGAGSDQRGIKTTARTDGDHYVINGGKVFNTWGNMSQLVTVFAKTDPEKELKGISAIVVERGTPGFECGPVGKKMGAHGSPTVELFFDDCRVPKTNLIGREGDGYRIALHTLTNGRVSVGALCTGMTVGALECVINYFREQPKFMQDPSDSQDLRFVIASHATNAFAARELLYRAAREIERDGEQTAILGAMAKAFASDTAMATALDAIQLLGERGYTRDYPVERIARDAKSCQIAEGTNEIQKVLISNILFK